MSWITCDMRFGRSEDQKRRLAAGVVVVEVDPSDMVINGEVR